MSLDWNFDHKFKSDKYKVCHVREHDITCDLLLLVTDLDGSNEILIPIDKSILRKHVPYFEAMLSASSNWTENKVSLDNNYDKIPTIKMQVRSSKALFDVLESVIPVSSSWEKNLLRLAPFRKMLRKIFFEITIFRYAKWDFAPFYVTKNGFWTYFCEISLRFSKKIGFAEFLLRKNLFFKKYRFPLRLNLPL